MSDTRLIEDCSIPNNSLNTTARPCADIHRVKRFARYHHQAVNQRRKYTGDPYIVHPAAVVAIVRSVPHTPEMIAAAWLHDTVEDTQATLEEIERHFGSIVARLVRMLTNIAEPHHGNRATRVAMNITHTGGATAEAKTIKLADIIHNAQDIARFDPDFACVYLREKRLQLEVLREGDATLWRIADDLIRGILGEEPIPERPRCAP